MATRNSAQYYRLGIFVLIGAAALVALVLIFGARNLFDKTMTVETYIKESVQGLDVGAPVRFRGVRIGQVKMINLSGQIYEDDIPFAQRKQYVVVRMEISRTTSMDTADEFINKLVTDGLRAQIRGQGTRVDVQHGHPGLGPVERVRDEHQTPGRVEAEIVRLAAA